MSRKSRAVNHYAFVGVHSTAGPMTLAALLERVTTHLPHHIAFIEAKLLALEE
jgi:hypothetical protein